MLHNVRLENLSSVASLGVGDAIVPVSITYLYLLGKLKIVDIHET